MADGVQAAFWGGLYLQKAACTLEKIETGGIFAG